MDKIARIRQEIERQIKFYDEKEREVLNDPKQFTYALFYQGHQKMCAKLLSFLDTLSEEPDKSLEEELQRYQDELYDFKVFAAKQAKEHHISFVHDFEWHNFCAGLLSYFKQNEEEKK